MKTLFAFWSGGVAQTVSLPCRGLAIRRRRQFQAFARLPVGDTAGCQPALQDRATSPMSLRHVEGRNRILEAQP
jgi:hypothetical protein